VAVSFIGGQNRITRRKSPTCCKSDNSKLYHIKLHWVHLAMSEILAHNYHMITATTAPTNNFEGMYCSWKLLIISSHWFYFISQFSTCSVSSSTVKLLFIHESMLGSLFSLFWSWSWKHIKCLNLDGVFPFDFNQSSSLFLNILKRN
jgi:hypothetical protein